MNNDRENSITWWNRLGNKDKDLFQRETGINRNYITLTGREIEKIWNYKNLKDAYKVESKSKSLFSYLLNNNEFNKNKLFHQLSKDELIEKYKELYKKHLELLENI